jgi:CheY-like chemotaxis protein
MNTALDTQTRTAPFGLRVLVVEDEALIAMHIEDILQRLGCQVVGPATSIDAAHELIERCEPFDVAILDVNLAGQPIYPVAQRLVARGCPFLFTTGYGTQGLLRNWRDRPTVQKPFDDDEIREGLQAALTLADGAPR